MRVLVCGGRDMHDRGFLTWVLNTLHARQKLTMVIHGCAQGADTLAGEWASQIDGCTVFEVPADWRRHGQRAGAVRNRLMLESGKPDLVLAFEGGAGTRDMTSVAVAAGVRVLFAEKLRAHFDARPPWG